ncbi:hypothetical protein M2273_003071 [Mucilaginibacter lappiensis]
MAQPLQNIMHCRSDDSLMQMHTPLYLKDIHLLIYIKQK